jgi:ketol-acid reductoisomerase
MLRQLLPNIYKHRIFKRSVSTFTVGGIEETIIERTDFPLKKCREIIGNNIVSVLGYGPQGRGQALNLKDNGFNVILGLRDGNSKQQAIKDGWVENKNLFSISEATRHGNIIQYLLSDVGQIKEWDTVKDNLAHNKTLYFSHGFGITYSDKTNIIPPSNVDVVLVAPKGSGLTVRNHFVNGGGINVSYAVHQDYTGKAEEKCLALAFGIGCGHAFKTYFRNEVYSDLTGERSVLMGLIQGAFSAQYKVLREKGHSPAEAYNETVEEALESLFPLISEKGMDWLYANCSTTAQRGALDWAPRFEEVLKPVIEDCYNKVEDGSEADIVIKANSDKNYRQKLDNELKEMANKELWEVARHLRKLRP